MNIQIRNRGVSQACLMSFNKTKKKKKYINKKKHTGRPRIWYQVLPVFFFFFFRWQYRVPNAAKKKLENFLPSKKGIQYRVKYPKKFFFEFFLKIFRGFSTMVLNPKNQVFSSNFRNQYPYVNFSHINNIVTMRKLNS